MKHPCPAAMFLVLFIISCTAGFVCAQETADVRIVRRTEITGRPVTDREIVRYAVEVVTTKSERERGLSGRASLGVGRGMLFPLSAIPNDAFWMAGMHFPIDILFFSREGMLLLILSDLQVCSECPLYPVPVLASFALEVNAGQAKRFGLLLGDVLVVERKNKPRSVPDSESNKSNR